MRNILCFLIGIIFGIVICGTIITHRQSYAEAYKEPEKEIETVYVYIESEPEIIYEKIPYDNLKLREEMTEQDEWYYMDLAMREAEGESVNGMLWVMYTGECRCEAFNQTVEEMWKSSAFEKSMNRTGLTPNENCIKAMEIFKEGWMPKPLYFQKGHYHGFGTPLCEVENHCFSMK